MRIEGKQAISSIRSDTETDSIKLSKFQTQEEEAESVVDKIKEISRKIQWIPSQQNHKFCVIARNRYVLDQVIKKIKATSIPYYAPMLQEKIVSKEVNLVLDFLKLRKNRNDKISFYKICEYLGLDYEDLVDVGDNTLFDVAIEKVGKVQPELAEVIKLETNKGLKNYLDDIFNVLNKHGTEEIWEDIEFIKNIYKEFKKDNKNEDLGEFLNFLAISSRKDGKGVAVLTGHASKGLEFDYVFIISLNQGIWPDYRAIKEAEKGNIRKLEEERRNCFVALTRTKEKLFISYVNFKSTRIGKKQPVGPSQFLYEMGLLKKENQICNLLKKIFP